MKLLIIFIVLNVVNVILQTVKSIVTVKCGKTLSALINAIAFGLYTILLVYMNCDLDLWTKAGVTAICNLIGVYVVKLFEEKMRKDKLWKIELSIPAESALNFRKQLTEFDMSFSEIATAGDKYKIFYVYAPTQKESAFVKALAERFNAKYFVSETKTL